MKKKKYLIFSILLISLIASGTSLRNDLGGIQHVNPSHNETVLMEVDEDTVDFIVEISSDEVMGNQVDSGDEIIVGEYKINDSQGNSYTHVGTTAPSGSRDTFTIESYDGSNEYEGYRAEFGNDVAVDKNVLFMATINKSVLMDNNISLGEDSELTFTSLWQFNNDGNTGLINNREITNFYVAETYGNYILTIIIPVLFLFVVLMLWNRIKEMS